MAWQRMIGSGDFSVERRKLLHVSMFKVRIAFFSGRRGSRTREAQSKEDCKCDFFLWKKMHERFAMKCKAEFSFPPMPGRALVEQGKARSLLRTLRIEWELHSEQSAEPAGEPHCGARCCPAVSLTAASHWAWQRYAYASVVATAVPTPRPAPTHQDTTTRNDGTARDVV